MGYAEISHDLKNKKLKIRPARKFSAPKLSGKDKPSSDTRLTL